MTRSSWLFWTLVAFSAYWPGLRLSAQVPLTAEYCGRCHRAIHQSWKGSSHAQAMESPVFQDSLELAEADFGAAARKICLRCHAPTAAFANDLNLTRKASWEGVTCDYCHSIRSVTTPGGIPVATVTFGLTKTGPLKDAVSSAHGTEYSQVHTSSLICAPCHEYRNAAGLSVLTTYSEWQQSRYAKEGIQCQSCHMSTVAGHVVDPRVKRSSVAQVNLHQMPGSHSLEQLEKAIKAQLTTGFKDGHLHIVVDVTNQNAGHRFPTGSPLRQLFLEVRADTYDGRHFQEQRVYGRQVVDRRGAPLLREHFVFVKGARVTSDTRLTPGEKRSETFEFPVPPGTRAQVKAVFRYGYSPLARDEGAKRVVFLTLNRLVQ